MKNPTEFTLAYSPCPNDTFLFYHLVHPSDDEDFRVREELQDVENLNQKAKSGIYDITKLSFAAYFPVQDNYDILESGSALGRGCGPLLIRKKGSQTNLANARNILIPGRMTTANLLLHLYASSQSESLKGRLIPVRYDQVIPKLDRGEGDLGVIIHEERFTYNSLGMESVADLGEWWESTTGHPIPLGCIAVHKRLGGDWKRKIDLSLKRSLEKAWNNPEIPRDYILANSQNKNIDVVESHIRLYVNNFTYALGDVGVAAISELRRRWESIPDREELG